MLDLLKQLSIIGYISVDCHSNFLSQWNPQGKRRADPQLAVNRYSAAMVLYNFDTGTAQGRSLLLWLYRTDQNLDQIFIGNAFSGILNFHDSHSFFRPEGESDSTGVLHRLKRIADQVDKHLNDLITVHDDLNRLIT